MRSSTPLHPPPSALHDRPPVSRAPWLDALNALYPSCTPLHTQHTTHTIHNTQHTSITQTHDAALAYIQKRFYEDFGPRPEEATYGFATASTLKPTQLAVPSGSINQIPGQASILGDVRITPWWDVKEVMAKVSSYVDDINADPDALARGQRGPHSK